MTVVGALICLVGLAWMTYISWAEKRGRGSGESGQLRHGPFTLTVSVVLVIAYYIAMSAFGIAVSDMKPFYAFMVFFVVPILLLPVVVWVVSDALAFAKAGEQLTREAIPAFGSLTELRDRVEVMRLKGGVA